MITQERLKEIVFYNQETGLFTWKINLGPRAVIGCVAGSSDDGYVRIGIDGELYLAHRLVFLYVDGYLPEGEVDHIDRVRWHNWRSNLREASRQCQNRNCGMLKNNKSGIKGVYWYKPTGKWQAYITLNRGRFALGYFDNIVEAACHRFAAEQCLGFQDCDISSSAGEFIKSQLSLDTCENGGSMDAEGE